ncbi:hypothetical protein LINPERPRIM_LOCUS27889, partial [Linum perenne]
WYKSDTQTIEQIIPFSAFWLRSSVVSVLISLISDMWSFPLLELALGDSQVSLMCCTIARAWHTPPILSSILFTCS